MLIIHGDNLIASRQFFLDQKKLLSNILELEGTDLTYARLVQALSTPNLFGEYPTLVIENLFSRRPSNEKKKIVEYLKDQNLLTYDSKDVSTQLKSFNPKFVKNFPLPKFIYAFLDSFSLSDLQNCLKSDPPELILGALAKHLHNLILVKEGITNLPSWQVSKLKSQAQKFTQTQLFQLNASLLEIDYQQKTSQSSLSLSSSLELWCIKNVY